MDSNNNKVNRGEIYYYDFGANEGSIQNGLRPVLIIQCNEANRTSTTTVAAPITTAIKKRYLPSHIYLGEECGLKKPSMVLLEQMRAINQCDLLDCVGCVSDEKIERLINNGLKKALGLWVYKDSDKDDIRCLCKYHLDEFKLNTEKIIVRHNRFDNTKQKCDKCDSLGYEYLVKDKLRKGGGTNG